jgi:KDO2-lipid IV(A) lauroyltransferase
MKTLRYAGEAALLTLLLGLCGLLPVDAASAMGGWLGRTVGPRLAASRKALDNLKHAMPELDEPARSQVIRDMWDNLGRVMTEYPHLEKIARTRTTVTNMELFDRVRDDGKPAIFIAAHLANWEVLGPTASIQCGFPLDVVYRAPNNPWSDRLLKKMRAIGKDVRSAPKSRAGARTLLKSLQDNRHVGILFDQKYNEGVPAPFFGRPAMTSAAFIHFVQKFDCPLVMIHLERLGGAHFRATALELPYKDGNGKLLPTQEVLAAAHGILENWILARPGQWLWLHRRWSERAEREYRANLAASDLPEPDRPL